MNITQYLTDERRRCDNLYAKVENAVINDDWEKAEGLFKEFKEKTLLPFLR